jgi:hypothetical protein
LSGLLAALRARLALTLLPLTAGLALLALSVLGLPLLALLPLLLAGLAAR